MPHGGSTPMTNMFEDAMQALTDRQGELEVRLDDVEVQFPFIHEAVRLSGTVTLRLHMRETPASGPRTRRPK